MKPILQSTLIRVTRKLPPPQMVGSDIFVVPLLEPVSVVIQEGYPTAVVNERKLTFQKNRIFQQWELIKID